jgi:biopolymer transport protein ExbB/TolQ
LDSNALKSFPTSLKTTQKQKKKMNKLKIAFGMCMTLLLLVSAFGIYSIIDQAVTLTYQKESYTDTENDLDILIEIINKTDLTKTQIKAELKDHKNFDQMDFKTDSVSLDRVLLIFDNNKLRSIKKQW